MSHQWDDFSKSLAEDSVPRRQSLRLLGTAIAGAVFSPLGTAWGAGPDPCKAFCNWCSTKTQKNQCLAACRACNGDTGRLGGSCGSYACCSTASCSGVCSDLRSDPNCGACGIDCRDIEETCCGTFCADLQNDFDNCGSCGFRCPTPGPYEFGECIGGACLYACVEGAVKCNGVCSSLDSDPDNCGACGNVCPGSAPVCNQGVCFDPACAPGLTWCQLTCVDLLSDNYNCGACNNQCPGGTACESGFCVGTCIGC